MDRKRFKHYADVLLNNESDFYSDHFNDHFIYLKYLMVEPCSVPIQYYVS